MVQYRCTVSVSIPSWASYRRNYFCKLQNARLYSGVFSWQPSGETFVFVLSSDSWSWQWPLLIRSNFYKNLYLTNNNKSHDNADIPAWAHTLQYSFWVLTQNDPEFVCSHKARHKLAVVTTVVRMHLTYHSENIYPAPFLYSYLAQIKIHNCTHSINTTKFDTLLSSFVSCHAWKKQLQDEAHFMSACGQKLAFLVLPTAKWNFPLHCSLYDTGPVIL